MSIREDGQRARAGRSPRRVAGPRRDRASGGAGVNRGSAHRVNITSPLDHYLEDILRAVQGGTLYSALALSLAIPDICGAIEYPSEPGSKRYRAWFDAWCQMHQSTLTAADCYALRCSYLHQAGERFSGSVAAHARLSHIQFTVGKAMGGWSSQFVPEVAGSSAKPAVRIPVETFCQDMARAAKGWTVERAADLRVIDTLSRLLHFRRAV